jgi:manganese-dependent inorganic pyrophosphatase
MQTIVIGHRNPDMDAICSAIAYAEFKRKLGMADVVAARAGNTNERIDFVLQKFGIPAPDFVSDLTPKVADLMDATAISVPHDSSVYKAIRLIRRAICARYLSWMPRIGVLECCRAGRSVIASSR